MSQEAQQSHFNGTPTWRLALLASDASFARNHVRETALRAEIARRHHATRPAFEVVGQRVTDGCLTYSVQGSFTLGADTFLRACDGMGFVHYLHANRVWPRKD